MSIEPETIADTAAPHPEEMKATVDLTVGRSLTIKATARTTPAGLVAAALLVASVMVPIIWLARNTKKRLS